MLLYHVLTQPHVLSITPPPELQYLILLCLFTPEPLVFKPCIPFNTNQSDYCVSLHYTSFCGYMGTQPAGTQVEPINNYWWGGGGTHRLWVPAFFIPIWVQNDFLATNPTGRVPIPAGYTCWEPYQHLLVTWHTHPQASMTVTQDGPASTPFLLSSLPTCSHSEDVGYLAEFNWVFRGLFVSLYVLVI